jgi:two-component system, sensor histidine kinase LadS
MRTLFSKLIVLFFAHCLPLFVQAGSIDTVIVNHETSALDFHEYIRTYIDRDHTLDISDLQNYKFGEVFKEKYIPEYYNGGNIYAGFYLKNQSSQSWEYIIEVGGYGEIQVFFRRLGDASFSKKITGRYIAYPENEIGNSHFRTNKIKVNLDPETTYEFRIVYPDPGWDQIKPEFILSGIEKWQFNQSAKDAQSNVWLGLFFGAALVLALINFVYFFIHREKAYLQYSIYIFTICYYEVSRFGIVDATPLIKYPVLYFVLENAILFLTVIFYLQFLKSFLNTKDRYPFWHKIANLLIPFLLLGLFVTLWLMVVPRQPLTAIAIRNLFLLITLPVAGTFFVKLAVKGNKIDQIFLLGSIVLVGTAMVSLLLDMFIKEHKYPDLIFQIGVIVELIIFSIGLGVKSRHHEKEKQKAQQYLIAQLEENERLQLSVNQELEMQVNERTKEIQAQNEELLTQQEELAAHRDILEGQNKIIAQSMEELQIIKSKLEYQVESRTQEVKNANAELVQRNNQLEQYAYITAHNLRAPVARLKGLVYIFEKIGAPDNQTREVVDKIANSALEMDEVLTDMNAILELKNKNYGSTGRVNVKTTLEKVKKILSDSIYESGALLKEDIQITLIHANEPYLESIIYNLFSNALKYRSEKRVLELSISTFKDGNDVVLKISDNGVGIDIDSYGQKLFGLYQRFHDHVGGKGMGLYLVKTQVEALGGSIGVESRVDHGTTFTITFKE